MINSDALESSNGNSLIVKNVIDRARSEHSVAQVQSSRPNSLLGLASFCTKGNFVRRSDNKNNRTLVLRMTWPSRESCLICLHVCELYKVQREHVWNLSFQNFSEYDRKQRESLTPFIGYFVEK